MIAYNNAKPSLHVEEQFPTFVRREGPLFVEFLRTYYDWLERRMVLLTLKAENDITEDQINTNQLLRFDNFIIGTEDGYIIAAEDTTETTILSNLYSLGFNGNNQYMTVSNSAIDISSDWSLGLWMKLDNYPSSLLKDMDVVSLSNANNLVLIKLTESNDQVQSIIGATTINTIIDVRIGEWNYVTVRYNDTVKEIYYDFFNKRGQFSYSTSLDLSANTSNRFALGYNAFSTDNFFNGKLDQVSTWNSYLSNTEIISVYNNGTPVDITVAVNDYNSQANLINYWTFETANTTVAVNSINPGNNGTLIHSPVYYFDIPINIGALITEYEELSRLIINTISHTEYTGGTPGVPANRMLLFAEHLSGNIQNGITLVATPDNTITIDSFIEAKNPLNVINNIENFQDIDHTFDYNNFVTDEYFQYLVKEIMGQFPMSLHTKFDYDMKSIISKNIKDFYKSKGTLQSIVYLFKILFNEDLIIGTSLYSDGPFSYVIKSKIAAQPDIIEMIKKVAHPVGYNLTLESL